MKVKEIVFKRYGYESGRLDNKLVIDCYKRWSSYYSKLNTLPIAMVYNNGPEFIVEYFIVNNMNLELFEDQNEAIKLIDLRKLVILEG